jgi:hypothetical protein
MRVLGVSLPVAIALMLIASAAAQEKKADDAKKVSTPEQRLKALEGKWRGTDTSVLGGSEPQGGYPELIRALASKKAAITVVGNTLTVDGVKEKVALANDLDLLDGEEDRERIKKQGMRGDLLMLTLPSGRALLASFVVADGKLRINYPWSSVSWRSGVVIELERVKE